MRSVKQERSGWRDERISELHREWGFDCPAIDIDFLVVEYDNGCPVALVEFKHEDAKPIERDHPSYRALEILATSAELPLFIVHYTDDMTEWTVIPFNAIAKNSVPQKRTVTQQEWVNFLYYLRNRRGEAPRVDE